MYDPHNNSCNLHGCTASRTCPTSTSTQVLQSSKSCRPYVSIKSCCTPSNSSCSTALTCCSIAVGCFCKSVCAPMLMLMLCTWTSSSRTPNQTPQSADAVLPPDPEHGCQGLAAAHCWPHTFLLLFCCVEHHGRLETCRLLPNRRPLAASADSIPRRQQQQTVCTGSAGHSFCM